MHRSLFLLGTTCALIGILLGSLFRPTAGPLTLSAQDVLESSAASPVKQVQLPPLLRS